MPEPDRGTAGSNAGFIAKFGVIYSGFAALVSDIRQPLFEFTLLFLVLCGVALAVVIVLGLYTRSGYACEWKTADHCGGRLSVMRRRPALRPWLPQIREKRQFTENSQSAGGKL